METKNVEHTASAVLLLFRQFCHLEKEHILHGVVKNIEKHIVLLTKIILYSFQNLIIAFILNIISNFSASIFFLDILLVLANSTMIQQTSRVMQLVGKHTLELDIIFDISIICIQYV